MVVALPPVPAGCYWLRSLLRRGESLPRLEPVELPPGESWLRPSHPGVKLWIKSASVGAQSRLYIRRLPDLPDAPAEADRLRTFGTEDCSERLIWPGSEDGATARDLDPGIYEVLLADPERGWVRRKIAVGTTELRLSLEPEIACSELVVQVLGADRPDADGWRLRLRSHEYGIEIVQDWMPLCERTRQVGMPQGVWSAELFRPDGSLASTASGTARAGRALTLVLR